MWYLVIYFVFFKQKTAYEMRISDWSSDVCSSDLDGQRDVVRVDDLARIGDGLAVSVEPLLHRQGGGVYRHVHVVVLGDPFHRLGAARSGHRDRSEEHTSELQSLMRPSYAVFCLKKKIA